MKTAAEWYIEAVEELKGRCLNDSLSWFKFSDEKKKLDEQAKQMEKEQIMQDYSVGYSNGQVDSNRTAEQYYDETYKNTNDEMD